MNENKFSRAKTCFLMMALGAVFTLIKGQLPNSNSALGGLLSLAGAVLTLIAIWRLRAVEEGYRDAFLVEIIAVISIIAGAGMVSWAVFSGMTAMVVVVAFLVAAVPMILGAVFQYFFCTATGRVMEELGAAREAQWSGWMWKLYGVTIAFGVLAAVLALFGIAPAFLTTLLSGVTLLVGMIQIIYFFLCYKALPT